MYALAMDKLYILCMLGIGSNGPLGDTLQVNKVVHRRLNIGIRNSSEKSKEGPLGPAFFLAKVR